jgi:hypothetical protein
MIQKMSSSEQQKTNSALMNEQLHNRKHIIVTDQNIGETEAVQKIAKAKKAADAAIQAAQNRYTSP